MKKVFYILLASLLTFPAYSVFAQDELKAGLRNAAQVAGYDIGAQSNLPEMIGFVIKSLIGLVGTIFMVLIVYAGVIWMTAQGSEERVTRAKKIISNSMIGLIIVIISYALTSIIFSLIGSATQG